jgi:integrase
MSISSTPAAAITAPSPKVERDRVLTDAELYEVWHAADGLGWPFGPVVQLLLLTAQREGEVAAMRWSEIDLAKAIWTLPSTRTKAGRAHLVPLSSTALRIIQAQPRVSDYVFPGRRTDGARPVCGFSKVKVRLDRISGVSGWTFHDLRRTTVTRLAELHVPPHVTEKILNHASSRVAGPMAKVYQVYDYLAERCEALELWAATLAQLVEPGRRLKAA